MTTTFAHLGLPARLVAALAEGAIIEAFPVQAATIPDVLAGRDVSGKAPTGSGKTLAFGLPLLARAERASHHRPRALILAPTRELAEQIRKELVPLGKSVGRSVAAVYGGVPYGAQKRALRKGVDVLVATPGRLEDLIAQRSVDLSRVDIAVIDEADRMADMGFLPAVRRILDGTSGNRQTLLFSATLDRDVLVLSQDYQHEPVRHEVGTLEPKATDVRHHFWLVHHKDRVQHTADAVRAAGRSIVFTRTRHRANRLAQQLTKLGVTAVALHGGRTQNQRTRALETFSSGRAQALVATDVAARGIHVDAVASVIHFDLAGDTKDYLHRSGRTARAGAAGAVVTLITGDQQRSARRIQRDLDLRSRIEAPRPDALRHSEHGADDVEQRRRRQGSEAVPASRPSRRRPDSRVESVYVANLPWTTTTEDLHALFGRHGDVAESTIITDRRTGRSKGYGFVDMPRPGARKAIAELHGSRYGGRNLTVRFAKPRQAVK